MQARERRGFFARGGGARGENINKYIPEKR
jgi:hypothetical protein